METKKEALSCLVLGGADGVWQDLDAAQAFVKDPIVIATNDSGVHYEGHLDYWVTLHPSSLPNWMKRRNRAGRNGDYITYSSDPAPGEKRHYPSIDRTIYNVGGSSGMLAVQVALELGIKQIILCGVPMDPSPHFFKDGAWKDYKIYRKVWERKHDELAPYVRSMSGWTREFFGPPSSDTEEKDGTEDRNREPRRG